jgi:hypothetical protein
MLEALQSFSAVAKYALYALAGVAVFSMVKLVREDKSLEKLSDVC